ncbi:hypothetical protein VME_45820 [Vibrio harveyi 1DA3]|nr:hypothetical protein VME_45820 [Vibrio harveyi 1DA3]
MADRATSPEWLINGILENGAIGISAGKSKAYKSFVALQMCYCIATGKPFLGRSVSKSGLVLYVAGEGGNGLNRRVKAIQQEFGDTDNFKVIKNGQKIHDLQYQYHLQEYIRATNPVLIVFDTYNQLQASGGSNNSSNDVTESMNMFKDVSLQAELNNTVLIIHHYGKDAAKGMEGSHAFTSNSDFVFAVSKAEEKRTLLECEKMKDSEPFEPIPIQLESVGLGIFDEDGDEVESLTVTHGRLTLVEKAKPSINVDRLSAERLHLEAIKHLHKIQKQNANSERVIILSKDIKSWLEKYTVKNFNRRWLKTLVDNREIKFAGDGQYRLI